MVRGVATDAVSGILRRLPHRKRLSVKTVTTDLSSAMMLTVRKVFPAAKLINDRFHVQQLMSEAVDQLRIRYRWKVLDAENQAIREHRQKKKETKSKAERERIGKWEPERMENGETLPQIVSRSKHIILKHWSKWNEQQKTRAAILFDKFPKLLEGYSLSMKLTDIFNKKSGPDEARLNLAKWYNEVEKFDYMEFNKVLDTFSNHSTTIINYFDLDIESIQWLENFLKTSAGAVVLVSHDRAFINNVTNRTIEISCGHIYDYKVAYDEFVVLRKERREQQLRAYENQQKQIQDTEDFIERFRYKATKAVQVQSRIKQLEKIVPIEIDDEDNSALRLKFPPAMRSGNYPVICDGVKKAYGSHIVFHDVTLTINRGEKVAFVGKNGEGKSTLVKCIMDEIPYEGKLTIGHNVQIGYFAQNQAQMLDENLSVFDTIDYVAKGDIRLKIRDILGAFMFGGEASDKKVKVLSGGERSRLAMIKLLLEPVNFLILDEPTNHLDMRSKDVLKEAIKEFDGTVIVVSHDREFLDGLVTKVYEFGGGVVKEHIGGIYDFLQKKKIESLNELQLSASPTMSATKKEELETVSENKLSYEAQKELNKKIRKLEKRIADCEQKIEKLETEIGEVEADMATPEGASDMALYEKHQKLKKDLDQTVEEWETVSMELEEMQGS